MPRALQASIAIAVAAVAFFTVNWAYQVARKPSELLFPVSGAFFKSPAETWAAYGPLFRRHSTAVLTPDLLAALSQVEGSGNPVVRTYWRWSLTNEPFEIYRPASSAVGMYQITDGTFAEARRYCVHRHVVVEQGPWYDVKSCWFNFLYTRTVPSHAVELTAAYLDRRVAEVLARQRITGATLRQKQNLATLIHLCGAGAGTGYARRAFSLSAGERCGAHDARVYLGRVTAMQRLFAQLAG
ncbi:MAG TPA: lytic transglycosylase domain-containing protein [Gammaproteobacteria bacterium]|nr:lytic transglycosylase domain-containing protein [Gammaproteobacteria bacterium]